MEDIRTAVANDCSERVNEADPIEIDIVYCEVCKTQVRKYKCPRCAASTCSLACCSEHKMKTGCDGKRDRTSFIAMSEFSVNNLRNDFHFLEDVLVSKDRAQRTMTELGSSARDKSNNALKQLIRAARLRGVSLSLMPLGMEKRRHNPTKFISKTNKIIWRIHIIFVLSGEYTSNQLLSSELHHASDKKSVLVANGALVGVIADSVDENKTLQDIIAQFIEYDVGKDSTISYTLRKLRPFRESLLCLIQKIPSSAENPEYIEIPLGFSIQDSLKGKTIIEYPTFVVSTADRLHRIYRSVSTVLIETVSSENSTAISEIEFSGDVVIEGNNKKHSLELDSSELVVGDNNSNSNNSPSPTKRIRIGDLQFNSSRNNDQKNSIFVDDIH